MDAIFFIACVISYNQVYTYTVIIKNLTTGVDWNEASNECGELGLEYDYSTLQTLEGLRNNQFWIGSIKYKALTPWFEPIGCFLKNISRQTFHASLGPCVVFFHRNISPYFGLAAQGLNHIVFQCLKSEEIEHANNFGLSCIGNSTDYMLVYEFKRLDVYYQDKDIIANEICLLAKCKQGKIEYHAEKCSRKNSTIRTVCQNGTTPNREITTGMSFYEAEMLCRKEGKLLLSSSVPVCNVDQLAWTNTMRGEIEVYYFKERKELGQPLSCRAGKRIDLNTTIEVTDINCSAKLEWFVCRTNPIGYTKNESENMNSSINIGTIIGAIGGVIVVVLSVLVTVYFARQKIESTPQTQRADQNDKIRDDPVTYKNELVTKHREPKAFTGNNDPTISTQSEINPRRQFVRQSVNIIERTNDVNDYTEIPDYTEIRDHTKRHDYAELHNHTCRERHDYTELHDHTERRDYTVLHDRTERHDYSELHPYTDLQNGERVEAYACTNTADISVEHEYAKLNQSKT